MPIGLRTPSCPSTTKPRGSMCTISRSAAGSAAMRAASITRSTSAEEISWSPRLTAITPRELVEVMCSPETPTYSTEIVMPAMRSVRSTASSMARVVASMSMTTPLRMPEDGVLPTPAMCTSPSSSASPTTAQTLVVPMSNPTTCCLRNITAPGTCYI